MATARRRKKETFSRWDAADYLKSEADMVAYLEACLEEAPDDAALLANALGDIARARGMVQLAKDTGLTREGLYKALSKDGNPRLGTVLKVMRALGLKFTAQAAGDANPLSALHVCILLCRPRRQQRLRREGTHGCLGNPAGLSGALSCSPVPDDRTAVWPQVFRPRHRQRDQAVTSSTHCSRL